MARVCRLVALLAALASAKEKKVIGPTSEKLQRCTPGPGTDEHKDCITSSQPVDLRCGKCRKTPYYIPFCTAYPGEFFHVLHDCILPEICLIEQLHQQNGSACYEDWQAHWVKFFAPHSQRAKTCGQNVIHGPRPTRRPCAIGETLERLLRTTSSSEIIQSNTSGFKSILLKRKNTRIFEPESFDDLFESLWLRGWRPRTMLPLGSVAASGCL